VADRIEQFEIMVPASTAIATPQTTALSMPDGIVVALEFAVPPGPSGLVGWMLLHSTQQVIPRTPGTYFVMDNDIRHWDLHNFPTGDAWAIQSYNTDVFPHTIRFTFLVDEFPPTNYLTSSVTLQPL